MFNKLSKLGRLIEMQRDKIGGGEFVFPTGINLHRNYLRLPSPPLISCI